MPSNRITLHGQFGRWTVLETISGSKPLYQSFSVVRCSCPKGTVKKILTQSLTSGRSKSCGCLKREILKKALSKPRTDISGSRFGRLVAVKYAASSRWLCDCDCGNKAIVDAYRLKIGHTKSCGCLQKEVLARGIKFIHGASKTPTWNIWSGLFKRCCDEKDKYYSRYGGRGISICSRWQGRSGYLNFLADMGERPKGLSLDRIDNDGNYDPKNCRWATALQQAKNKTARKAAAYYRDSSLPTLMTPRTFTCARSGPASRTLTFGTPVW